MKRIKGIRQNDTSDCGAACLTAIAGYYGYEVPLGLVREWASTGISGTNIKGITEAAEKMGLTARGVKGPFEAISQAPLPAIAHVRKENSLLHFVVIIKINSGLIHYMDPAEGRLLKMDHLLFQKLWTGILVLISPAPSFTRGNLKTPLLSRFIQLLKPFRTIVMQAFAGAVIYSILGLSTSLYVQKIVDYVLVDGNMHLLHVMSIIMIVILLFRTGISYLKNLYLLKTGQMIDAGLMMAYYRHLLKLPQKFFDTMRTGEIISRIGDAVKIRNFLNSILVEILVSSLSVSIALVVMASISLRMSLIVGIFLAMFSMIYYLYNSVNRKVLRKSMEKAADLESHLIESIGFARTVKEFNLQEYATGKTENRLADFIRTNFRSGSQSIRSSQASGFLSGLLTIILLWFGSSQAVKADMSPGELLSFYTLLGYMLVPVASLISMNRDFQDAKIAADRLFQILDLEHEPASQMKIPADQCLPGDIEFRDVEFRYGSRQPVFEGLNLRIPHGKFTGILGISGSGKSSLAAMLLNLYQPQKGKILIGKYDISQLDQDSLRSKIGFVPQQINIFRGSILENIAPGVREPDFNRIFSLLEATGLSSLISGLPEQLFTRLGEQGLNLSGGERQKLAFARALYHDPPILILDEPTSSLDIESEKHLLQTINNLRKEGKTIILISHKIKSVQDADKIILLSEGKVEESGRPQDLNKNPGRYQSMLLEQNGMTSFA